ncbi:OLC1v1039259C1 [Oldenlandia corymbosa var. corymbosa]|nr:OLC1v1039259C1 [Oldenlandia corymbosa var. corymbosa]
MDRISNSEESYDVGSYYRNSQSSSSSSVDQSDQSPVTEAAATRLSMKSENSFCRTSSDVSAFSEPTDDNSSYSETPSPLYWPMKSPKSHVLSRLGMQQHKDVLDDETETEDFELEMMKERFSKLLLGQDMSGSGKGVSTAVAISNSITNLYASIFGPHLRLEPLHTDKKSMWKREMSCFLSICDYIVEFVPTIQELQDGTALEVMASSPRSDICISLPALKKLDALLLDILDSFAETEFWYEEQGSRSEKSTRSGSFRRILPAPQRKEEKWWLPVPCVPSNGLSEESRKHLRNKRDCANQIHKAAKALNNSILSEMEIPDSYISSLPKTGKTIVGDTVYRYMCTSDKFIPDLLLNHLNLSSEHEALELADKIEASMYTWRRKACSIPHSKSSWDIMKDFMSDTDRTDKNIVLAERAESLLFCLKQRYPELAQTSLDTSKIQHNRDVGKAILESYSRVLEGLAFNIVAWIEDVMFVDKTMQSNQ